MREKVISVGRPSMVGVVTEPKVLNTELPAILLLNSGVMHQIGSCRMSVRIARALAEDGGLLTCRFDLPGIGDSLPRSGQGSFGEGAVPDVQEVMDYLEQKWGIKSFLLYGLCSGGVLSYKTALEDSRVKGFVQIDGYCYGTRKQWIKHYLPRLFSLDKWGGLLSRLLKTLVLKQEKTSAIEQSGINEQYLEVPEFSHQPPKETVVTELKKLVNDGVHMLSIFTYSENYNYTEQYRDCFNDVAFKDLLTVEYYPNTDHIITPPASQKEITQNIVDWMIGISDKK